MGQLEKAGPSALPGAGESPLLVAEELAFQEVLRKGRHVDGNKGPIPPGGSPVKGVGQQLLAGARLPHQQHGAVPGGHAGEHLLGAQNGGRGTHHVVKAVLGLIALVEQLGAQAALADLHIVEALQQGKGADARALAHHRHHLHTDQCAVDAHHLGPHPLPVPQARAKGDVGEHLVPQLSLHQGRADPGELLGVAVAGEDLVLFVDADDPVGEDLHEDVELALQPDGLGEHLVEAIIAGGDGLEVAPELLRLQQMLQPQTQGDLDHHAGGAGPLAHVDLGLDGGGHIAHLVGGDGDVDVLLQLRPGVEGNPADVVDAQLLQLGDGLPGHSLRHIHKQHPASRRDLLELAQLAPAEGGLHRHGLAPYGHVPGQFLR